MQGTAWRGAAAGAAIGVVVALVLAVLVFGIGGDWGFEDAQALPGLYFIALVVGVVVGSATGAISLVVGVLVARASKGAAADRRLRGTLAAAGCSAAVSTFTIAATLFGPGLIAALVAGALGGVAAWLLLPSQLDLSAAPRPIVPPAQPSADPGPGMSALNRGVITIVVAGGGSFLATNIVMTIISSVAYVKRDVANVLAIAVLVVAFAVIGGMLWRYLARRQPAVTVTKS